MRTARILAPRKDGVDGKPAIYHCVSRVVDRQLVFGRVEKEKFLELTRLYERFCGVRVLTHSVMSNHFHLLLEVPPAPREELGDEEFLSRLRILYTEREVEKERRLLEQCREHGHEAGASAIKARYTYRMWDLSEFMKTLKQRFSFWFNKTHGRRGTLWEERFKSVLVEDGYTARVMGAYIDLNPVRAGIVTDPKDYRWCGYAEALAGGRAPLEGIVRLMGYYEERVGGGRRTKSPGAVMAKYRVILFEDGEEVSAQEFRNGECQVARRGMTRPEVQRVRKAGGKLSRSQLLRHRVATFVNGAVIGSQKFVEEVFDSRNFRSETKRRKEAYVLRESAMLLYSLRGRGKAIEG